MKKLLSLLLIATLTTAIGWAETSTLTFTAACGGSGTADDGVTWTVTSDGTESNFDSDKGIHYGTNSAQVQYIKLSTTGINGTITKVVVNASTASGVTATASVTVGGNAFGGDAQSLSTTATDYTFNGSASGEIVVTVTKQKKENKALYVKSVAVTYTTTPPIPTVTGIAEFKALEPGTIAQLYLPDSYYARVTHVEIKGDACDAYIRDNDGALRMTGISPNRNMAYNQHIAGYITGKYTIGSDGLPQFEPVDNLTNTAFLVIADRVSESNTLPKPIDSDMIDYHLADWVTINEVKVTINEVTGTNNVTGVYKGAIVDVNAIVANANGTLRPVDDREDANPITYVIDSQENFVSPPSPIQNAQVRLKRTLTPQDWSLLTLPFDVTNFNGEVLKYKDLTFGEIGTYEFEGVKYPIESGIMHFDYYDGTMQAGMPYMVKPSGAQNLTFKGVTLSDTIAGNVTKHLGAQNTAGINLMDNEDPIYVGDYSLVGTYSPMTLPVDKKTIKLVDSSTWSWTELLKELDESYDSNIAGTEAYITVPDGAGIKIELPDGGTITSINGIKVDSKAPQHAAIYNIMGVRMTLPLSQLPPGIYIVNGKKIVKF